MQTNRKTEASPAVEATAIAILEMLRVAGGGLVRHTKLIALVGHEHYSAALDLIQARRKTKIVRVRGQGGGVALA
jgi:hypothetical protein